MTALPAPRWYTPAGYVRMPDGLRRLPWSLTRAGMVMRRVSVYWPHAGLSVDVTKGAECGCVIRYRHKDMTPYRLEWRGIKWDDHEQGYRQYELYANGEPCDWRSDPMWTYYNAPHGRGGVGPNYAGD